MSLYVESFAWLTGALFLLTGAVGLSWAVRRGRSWRWAVAGVGMPLVAAACVALALAGIRLSYSPEVVVLLDLSPSTRGMPWHDPAWVRDLATRRLPPEARVHIVGFSGRRQELLHISDALDNGAPWPAAWTWAPRAADDAGTDLAAALALRSPDERSAETTRPRWVISDGLFPTPAPPSAAAFTILPPASADAGVVELIPRPASGEKNTVEILSRIRVARFTSDGSPLQVRWHISRDDRVLETRDIDFDLSGAGFADRWISFRDTMDPAQLHRYQVNVQLLTDGTGDTWPENDTAELLLPPASGRRVLVVGETPPTFPHTQFISTAAFAPTPRQLAAEGWHAIVLNDVPAESLKDPAAPKPLSAAAARTLQLTVVNNGTGLLLLANGHAFGPGRYGESPGAADALDALSPVASRQESGGSRHIVFLLDASSSMNEPSPPADAARGGRRIAIAAAATVSAVRLLATGDHVTVIAFNRTGSVIFDQSFTGETRALESALAKIDPQGDTHLDGVLPPLQQALEGPSPSRLVVLLTDGEIPSADIPTWRNTLAAPATKFAIIAPGSPSSPQDSVLRQLAAIPGTLWLQSPDAREWPDALRDVVLADSRGKLHAETIPWITSDNTLQGTAPGWTSVWPNPLARIFASGTTAGNRTIPVAAVAQRGLGKVAAITLSESSSPAYQDLLQRMLAEVAAADGDRRYRAQLTPGPSPGRWLLAIDAWDDAAFINGETLEALITGSSETTRIPLPQTGPGRYQATFAHEGPLAATITDSRDRKILARVQSSNAATGEWPATVPALFQPPAGSQLFANVGDTNRWQVSGVPIFSLAPVFWLGAAIAALAALALRK